LGDVNVNFNLEVEYIENTLFGFGHSLLLCFATQLLQTICTLP